MFCRLGSLALSRPGRRDDLVERAMNPPRLRVDHLGQRVKIRAFELRELPLLDDLGRQRVSQGQPLEHVLIGAGACLRPFEDRQLQLLEQHLAKLQR